LGSVKQVMMCAGLTFVNALGIKNAVSWDVITILCIIPTVLSAFTMFFMPETPYYLITKNKEQEAKKSLQWLRGIKNVSNELDELKRAYSEQKKVGKVSYLSLITNKVYFKPFFIMNALMFIQQFSGVNAVMFYLKDVFIKANTNIDPGLSAFIISIDQVIATLVAVFVVDKFGRKPLLAFSSFVMCISIIALGTFFYLDENKRCDTTQTGLSHPLTHNKTRNDYVDELCQPNSNIDRELVSSIGWLPLVSLTIYMAAMSLGFGPLPWVVNAEIFPDEAKDKGTSIITLFSWLCAFLVSKFQKNVNDAINPSGGYFLFGAVLLLGTVFVIICTPETKGQTNEDMRNHFLKSKGIIVAEIGRISSIPLQIKSRNSQIEQQ